MIHIYFMNPSHPTVHIVSSIVQILKTKLKKIICHHLCRYVCPPFFLALFSFFREIYIFIFLLILSLMFQFSVFLCKEGCVPHVFLIYFSSSLISSLFVLCREICVPPTLPPCFPSQLQIWSVHTWNCNLCKNSNSKSFPSQNVKIPKTRNNVFFNL